MSNNSAYAIKIKSLYKSFGNNNVLQDINLAIKKDSSMVILGGSGTGKSVLIKTIIGLIKPDYGSIIVDNIETVNCSKKHRNQILQRCGFLFQNGALFDSLNVKENIIFFAKRLFNLSESDNHNIAVEKLSLVGLGKEVLTLYPSELSGGMQKRVALARAICHNPQIIFFDEPTTGLDPIMANVINELITKIRKAMNVTTVTITHDMNSLYKIATDIAYIYKGKILWTGKKEELDDIDNEYLKQFISGSTVGPMQIL
ncbi:MAG: ABC transporter ATP-binding protein [Rickettsiaceae bacterium]